MPALHRIGTFAVLAGTALGTQAQAQAQNGPTIFGVVDTAVASTRAGPARTDTLDSGVILGTRVGFRGNEDLGSGTQALYMLEMGINNDTGALGQGGLAFGRQAYVGLANQRFGRLTMGRHYTVLHTTLATYTQGGLIWGNALNYFRDGSVLRLDNSVRYESPNWSGFSFKVLGAFGEQPGSTGDVLNPSFDYRNGAWQVGATWMKRHKTATNAERYATVGTSYDFGWAKTALAIYRQRDELPAATSLARDAYEVSASVPVGAHAVWLSYGADRGQARPDTGAHTLSARFDYLLSKRTRLYTGYSVILNDGKAAFTVNSASNAGPVVAAGSRVGQAILGVTHTF